MADTLTVYGWWDQVPANLKTKTQLGELGKKPNGPVRARIHYGKGRREREYDLYDVGEAKDKQQATPAQLAALEAARIAQRTCGRCGRVVERPSDLSKRGNCETCVAQIVAGKHRRAHDSAIAWARQVLLAGDVLILDTETTDLYGSICEIAVIDLQGNVVFDTLINPHEANEATHIHGITDAMTSAAPTFADIEPELRRILHGRRVVVYNADYDSDRLQAEVDHMCRLDDEARVWLAPYPRFTWNAAHNDRTALAAYYRDEREFVDVARDQAQWWIGRVDWHCAMAAYAAYVGDWHDYYKNYRYQALGGGHRALGDCRACLAVVERMAASPLAIEELLMPEDQAT